MLVTLKTDLGGEFKVNLENIWAVTDAKDILFYLDRVAYPVCTEHLLEAVGEDGASALVLAILGQLPSRVYSSRQEIIRVLVRLQRRIAN
jgi:hypothetical protein